MSGLNYVWALLPQAPGAQAALLGCSSCDAFSLPLFHTLDMILPSMSFPAVPHEDFTWCLSVLRPSPPAEYCMLPLPSGITKPFKHPPKVALLKFKAHRASIAVSGTVHTVYTTWEVGSGISSLHISHIPGARKRLPVSYNFASLQAINAWSLSAFCIVRQKACCVLLAASVQT